MKKTFLSVLLLAFCGTSLLAQEVSFEEYDLDNGMHVILHQDATAPVVTTSVMYHVGGKDRTDGRTGFAHFFEHLLFEGTENIERGKWFEIVSSNGGTNNANTSQDRTYYYEVFPSNNLELGLWLESERLMHPVIGQDGVDTQNEVVKEERRSSYDNRPYGQLLFAVSENLFSEHPYKDPNVGYMEDLDAATLEEFQDYFKKYYVPNNATLVVAGDIDISETKDLIEAYFGSIPRGEEVIKSYPVEKPITEQVEATVYDANIQIPAAVTAYRTPGYGARDTYVLNMISDYLSSGNSSVLYKKLVDEQKQALQVSAFNLEQEDYGMYLIFGLPLGETSLTTIREEIEEEIEKLRTDLIDQKDFEKLQNMALNDFVNSNSSVSGIAGSLATYHMLYDDTNLINTEIDIYRDITREEIREVAQKYLSPNQRVLVDYLPEEKTAQ
ncbi:MAG: pitrilysin family protein [Leeuwenhoekiella sp.]